MIRAVVFDLDNTLYDFMKMKRQAIEAAIPSMIDAGLVADQTKISAIIDEIYREQGMEYQQVFDKLLESLIGCIDLKILSAGVVAYRKAREAALIPYPHVYATLHSLAKSGIKLGILSDAPGREAWLRLAYMNLLHIFDTVVTHDDTQERKPHPKTFTTVLERLNVSASESLMVGDWPERDVLGARNMGMKTAFAKYGDTFNAQDLHADYVLTDISQIIDIVKKENEIS